MVKKISRSVSFRSMASHTNVHEMDAFEKFMQEFENMRFVDGVVETVVNDIFSTLHDVDVDRAMEGGILTCSHTAKCGSRIEINAIDLEKLASEKVSDSLLKQRVEARMRRQADMSINSIEAKTFESMLGSVCKVASKEGDFLAVHEIEDISFFTVISPGNAANGQFC